MNAISLQDEERVVEEEVVEAAAEARAASA